MFRMDRLLFAATLAALTATPGLAGVANNTPAPIAGLGVGAVALIGFGYRALKKRVNR